MVGFEFLTVIIPPVQEKDREKKEKEKDVKEKDKKAINGHLFTPISSGQATQCSQCNKAFNSKEAFHCTRKYFCLIVCLSFLPVLVLPLFVRASVALSLMKAH